MLADFIAAENLMNSLVNDPIDTPESIAVCRKKSICLAASSDEP